MCEHLPESLLPVVPVTDLGAELLGHVAFLCNILRTHPGIFHSGRSILHSRQQDTGAPTSAEPRQRWLVSIFLERPSSWVFVGSHGLRMYLSLRTDGLGHLWPFTYLLWRAVYSNPSAIFALGCLLFSCWVHIYVNSYNSTTTTTKYLHPDVNPSSGSGLASLSS